MRDIAPWLPTIGAVLAAVVAGIFASRTQSATAASQRIMELEKRLAASRLETYKPLLEAIATYFDKTSPMSDKAKASKLLDATRGAATWLPVYGSDETVRAFHRMMQAGFASAPGAIMVRLYGQLLLAIRREIGDSATGVSLVDLLGIRINDIYQGFAADLALSDEDSYRKHDWTPPWKT